MNESRARTPWREVAGTIGLTLVGGALTAIGVAAVLTTGLVALAAAAVSVVLGAAVTLVSHLRPATHPDAPAHRVAGFAAGVLLGLVVLMIAVG